MKVELAFISSVGRLRTTDQKQVDALKASIGEVGLLNPITVYPKQIYRNSILVDGYGLIAGAHRLEAARQLGWTEIEANVLDLQDANDRIIAECDENLCGTSLTPAERAFFTEQRKKAYEAKHQETKHGGDRRSAEVSSGQLGHLKHTRFTEDTATKTGISERVIRRDAERGAKIADDVIQVIRGTKLDKGVYLDKLKNLTAEEQMTKVKADMMGKPKAPVETETVKQKQVNALMSAWNRAGEEARNEFLDKIGM